MDCRKVLWKKSDSLAATISKSCRLGQTEVGSYAVNLVCPLVHDNGKDKETFSLFDVTDEAQYSATREAVNQLVRSVQAVRKAIDKDDYSHILSQDSESEHYISAAFIDLLSKMGIAREGSSVSFSVRYALAVPKNTLEHSSVQLSHEYYEPLNALVSKLKVNSPKLTDNVI